MLPSRGQRGLARGGRKRRDAILDVAVARADLPWLVADAAAATEFVGGAEQFGRRLELAVLTDDHRRRLEGVSAAPEVAVTAEDLDGLGDERGRVSELIPVVGDDPAPFDGVGDAHRRAGRSQELVGFCGESLGLVEIRRQERGVGQRIAEPHRVAITAEPVDCLPDERVRLGQVAGAPSRVDAEVRGPRGVPCGPREQELLGGGRVGFG